MASAPRIAFALVLLSAPAFAGGGGGLAPGAPISSSGVYKTVLVQTNTSVLGAVTTRVFLDLKNEDTAYPVQVTIGAATFTLAPGADKIWESSYVPADAITATAADPAGSNLTIGSQ